MIATVVASVLLFIYYAQPSACIANKLFIGINSVLCLLICVFSLLPCVTRSQFLAVLLSVCLSVCLSFVTIGQWCINPFSPTLFWLWQTRA